MNLFVHPTTSQSNHLSQWRGKVNLDETSRTGNRTSAFVKVRDNGCLHRHRSNVLHIFVMPTFDRSTKALPSCLGYQWRSKYPSGSTGHPRQDFGVLGRQRRLSWYQVTTSELWHPLKLISGILGVQPNRPQDRSQRRTRDPHAR